MMLLRRATACSARPGLRPALLRAMCLAMLLWLPGMAFAQGRAIIVLDASGSMWDELDGRPKLEIARQALDAVLQTLPADAELGLLAYGHREKGNCADIELIVPPAKGRASAISTAAAFMNFTGKTPLTAAVRAAAQALDSTHAQATVVLITDGVDNCSGDPCALATELEAANGAFTAHVVGFGLTPDEAATVSCLASQTGGSYLQADDLATLTLALQDTVLVPLAVPPPQLETEPDPQPETQPETQPEPPSEPQTNPDANPEPAPQPDPTPAPVPSQPNFAPVVRLAPMGPVLDEPEALQFTLTPQAANAAGPAVYDGVGSIVPPGAYLMETRLGAVTLSQPLTVPATGLAAPEVILNAASVTLSPRTSPLAAVEPTASVMIANAAGPLFDSKGTVETWLPADEYTITTRLDAVTASRQITLTAGQTLTQDLLISAATVEAQVFYTASQPVNADNLQIEIIAASGINGQPVLSRSGPKAVFYLGAGDYIAVTTLGMVRNETPFSIALVQRTALPIVLNAGVLAVTAPGASAITIGPPPDIAGNAPAGTGFAGDSVLETLPAGSYLVTARFGDQTTQSNVVITPGGRTDLMMPPP